MQKRTVKPEVLQETDHYVVINKPSGLLSVPARSGNETSLKDILLKKYGSIYTVHRLDKDTSGIIVFAKNEQTHKYLSGIFESREVLKQYIGIVYGTPSEEEGKIDAAIMEHPVKKGSMVVHHKGKPSLTSYKVINSFGAYACLQFIIHTGRTHQIRVHMKHIQHPIVCDTLYSQGEPVYLSNIKKKFNVSKNTEEQPLFNRLALHASLLSFKDEKGDTITIETTLPKDMNAFLNQLKKHT